MSQREDLLAAARRLLVEKGYHRTTARDIAAASGSHLASIGYHFGSKDALMSTAALQAQGEWGHAVDTAVEAAGGSAGPAERLRICVDQLLVAMAGQREVLVASVQTYAQAEFEDGIRSALVEGTRDARASLAGLLLDRSVADLDPSVARGTGSVIHALIAGLALQAFLDPDSLPTGEQVVEAVRALGAETQAQA
ncbi:TetR/AcrR family transcriptional regulator [Flindersiella endophytica]